MQKDFQKWHNKKAKIDEIIQRPFDSEASVAVLSQIRLIDGRRLSYKIGDIAESDFLQLKAKLKALMP